MDKLSIANEMAKFDAKDRNFFDSLSEEEQKKFSPYLMIRWGSAVEGSSELQAYYLMSVNERLNKNFFDISTAKHKKFQWLLATTVSPGCGKQYHKWISGQKKDTGNNKIEKILVEMYPSMKLSDIRMLIHLNTEADLKSLLAETGMTNKQIKEIFK